MARWLDLQVLIVSLLSVFASGPAEHSFDLVNMGPPPRPTSTYQTACLVGDHDNDLIKPKKLLNPVRESKSHQEVQHELLHTCRR